MHDDQDGSDHSLRRPETRHLRPAQEGPAFPAGELRREFRPVDLRLYISVQSVHKNVSFTKINIDSISTAGKLSWLKISAESI